MLGKDRIFPLAILIFAMGFLLRSIPEATPCKLEHKRKKLNQSWGSGASDGWITLGLLSRIRHWIFRFSIIMVHVNVQFTSTDASNIVLGGAMKTVLVLIKVNLQLVYFSGETLSIS